MRKIAIIAILLVSAVVFYFINNNPSGLKPPLVQENNTVELSGSPVTSDNKSQGVEVLLTNLETPWDLAFLPDKTLFITERKGLVWQLDGTNRKQVLKLNDVASVGEGGLLGIAHHPNHTKNGYTYLYYTYERGGLKNKVVRFSHIGDALRQDKVIIDNIPGNVNHNGGRIKFGPDKKLYITTGDSENPSTAQDLKSLAGKILRLNDDGTIPQDNPFSNSPIYSYGHRNPQGLAWGKDGRLWSTEHGHSAQDEVNVIYPGANYNWPDLRGSEQKQGNGVPFVHSDTVTWAPSGAVIKKDTLYFTGLKGKAIYAFSIKPQVTLVLPKDTVVKDFLKNQYGRMRAIELGPDGNFYILTSNRDGRGNPVAEDDRLIKIPPNLLEL